MVSFPVALIVFDWSRTDSGLCGCEAGQGVFGHRHIFDRAVVAAGQVDARRQAVGGQKLFVTAAPTIEIRDVRIKWSRTYFVPPPS